MPLQQLMKESIESCCGKKTLITTLEKYQRLVPSLDSIHYNLLIIALNEIYTKKEVNVVENTIQHLPRVEATVKMLQRNNKVFKNPVLKMLIKTLEFNINYVSCIKKLA